MGKVTWCKDWGGVSSRHNKKSSTLNGENKVNVLLNLRLVDEHDPICVVEATEVVTS